jgi:hypothetical protein
VPRSRLSSTLLRVFVLAIAVTALVGAAAIAMPRKPRWIELRIILTTAAIAGASVCGLACGGCMGRGHRVLPTAGLVLTTLATVLLLIGIWAEINADAFWKTTLPLIFFAVACAHLSMLFMANLAGRYRWAFLFAYQIVFGLAALLSVGMISEKLFDNDSYMRCVGVMSVLVAAITLLVPVFHYMSYEKIAAAKEATDPVFALDEEIARLKKRLMELQSKRRSLLIKEQAAVVDSSGAVEIEGGLSRSE